MIEGVQTKKLKVIPDEGGRLMNDFTGRVRFDDRRAPQGTQRTYVLALDAAQYQMDMDAVAEGCDALVVATEWEQFKKLDLERARKALTHPILFDGRNLFDPAEMERMGFIYKSIGR